MRVNFKVHYYIFVRFNIQKMKSEKSEIQLNIINKIKELRQADNISQAKICDIIDLNSVGQVGNIESPKYKHKYTLQQLFTLSCYFNYPIEDLFLSESELNNPVSDVINSLILKLIEYEK